MYQILFFSFYSLSVAWKLLKRAQLMVLAYISVWRPLLLLGASCPAWQLTAV